MEAHRDGDDMKTRPRQRSYIPWLACILAGGWALFACGPSTWEPVPDPPQHIKYDTVRIEYGEGDDVLDPTESDFEEVQQKLVGETSEIANFTLDTIAGTNKAFYSVLDLVDRLKKFKYTYDRDTLTYTWEGRGKQGNYMRLEVRARAVGSSDGLSGIAEPNPHGDKVDESHTFALFYGTSVDDNELVADGEFERFVGVDAGGRQQGEGILRIYFDNRRLYDSTSPRGVMRIAFRSNNGVRQVRTGFFRTYLNSPEQMLNTVYEYEQFADSQGRFRFFGNQNIDGQSKREFVSVNAAWTRERDGIAAVHATGGNLGDQQMLFRQCWDSELIPTFMVTRPSNPDIEGGSKEDCDPALVDLMLEAPAYVDVPEQDPGIPEPHAKENP